jgi:hypothetical protein
MPVYRSTRDSRNAPLWNPRTKELLNVEDDDAGRLAGFRARFGGGYDAQKSEASTGKKSSAIEQKETTMFEEGMETSAEPEARQHEISAKDQPQAAEKQVPQRQYEEEDVDEDWDFGDEDENVLDLISRFGQEEKSIPKDVPMAKKKK